MYIHTFIYAYIHIYIHAYTYKYSRKTSEAASSASVFWPERTSELSTHLRAFATDNWQANQSEITTRSSFSGLSMWMQSMSKFNEMRSAYSTAHFSWNPTPTYTCVMQYMQYVSSDTYCHNRRRFSVNCIASCSVRCRVQCSVRCSVRKQNAISPEHPQLYIYLQNRLPSSPWGDWHTYNARTLPALHLLYHRA